MEDKSFSWILQILALKKIKLPILETYIISENRPIWVVSIKNDGVMMNHVKFKTISDLFVKLLEDHQFLSKLKSIGNLICYSITKTERIRVKDTDIKEFSEANTSKLPLYVQPARPNAEEHEVYYILRLEYTQLHYFSSFFKQIHYEKHPFFDSRIFEFACDVANTIMSMIEKHTKKRVMILELEFLEDFNRDLWVSFFRDIKIAEPLICLHYSLKSPNDLKTLPIKSASLTKFTKLTNGLHLLENKKKIQKPPVDYTFVKGHIRNKKSDLRTNRSILAPNSEHVTKVQRSQSKVRTRRISIVKSGIRTCRSQPRENRMIEGKRARALHDEIMKSPALKTKFRLTGLVGILGVEMEKNFHRSFSESNFQDKIQKTSQKKRPKSRLVLRYNASPIEKFNLN